MTFERANRRIGLLERLTNSRSVVQFICLALARVFQYHRKTNDMMTILQNTRLLLTIAVAACLASCSNSLNFVPSTVVPGANGNVKVKTDKNRNYEIDVNVRNLAEPSLLADPKANYVVWMETQNNGTQNLGRLVTSRGLFSKTMKGSLTTVTPHVPIKFLITAEDQADAQYPSDETILTSESNLRVGN